MKIRNQEWIVFLLGGIMFAIGITVALGATIFPAAQVDQPISEIDYIWVDFDVTGTIRVTVNDTNCGEVPDEAWEEARRVLGEFGNYTSLDLSVKDYGHYTEVITP